MISTESLIMKLPWQLALCSFDINPLDILILFGRFGNCMSIVYKCNIKQQWFLLVFSSHMPEWGHFHEHIWQHFAARIIGILLIWLSKSNETIPSVTGCYCCANECSICLGICTYYCIQINHTFSCHTLYDVIDALTSLWVAQRL